MRLENVLALTYGKLVNSPFVSNFENIVFESSKVKRGDLFIAFDEADIENAIFNGAYGIIFDKPTQITDDEIAWIKVTDILDAIKRLLRFNLIEKDITVFATDEITIKLAQALTIESTFQIIDTDIKSIFIKLSNIERNSYILFCPTLSDESLFTNIKNLPIIKKQSIEVVDNTIFETSFIYKNIFYEKENISSLFIPYLENIVNLLDDLQINFKIKKLSPIKHFEPYFINKKFEQKEFGSTDIVVIFETNKHLAKKEIRYLDKHIPWAKNIYIIPYETEEFEDKYERKIYRYKHKREILTILKNHPFNFALVIGADANILDSIQEKHQKQSTQLLFEF